MRLVVVGNGMVGQELLRLLAERGLTAQWTVVAFGDEPRAAYDRVHLSELFAGRTADDLAIADPAFYRRNEIDLRTGSRVERIDRDRRVVVTADGAEQPYDKLVLATGSVPFVPPIPGARGPGRFVYRTVDDLDAIRAHATGRSTGAVIGGGLLGLEAANALRTMGLETHVVELAPRLMAVQLDPAGGAVLQQLVESLGVRVHTGAATTEISDDNTLRFADGGELAVDTVVWSAGIRPRDELARAAGLDVGERGGVRIDDSCVTSDPHVYAIGECALWGGRIFGLVAPGYRMAEAAAAHLAGERETRFRGSDMSTKLKLLGVDVASFGDAHARTDGARTCSFIDEIAGVYKKLVLSADGTRLLGGILVGDAADYGTLLGAMRAGVAMPERPERLLLPAPEPGATPALGGPESLPSCAQICSCNNVCKGEIVAAIRAGVTAIGPLKEATRCGTGCGGCVPLATQLLRSELAAAGVEVSDHLCEHFPHSRRALYDIVLVRGIRTFDELLQACGAGLGCEVCKPAVTSILASVHNDHILDDAHAGLQDTNDRFLANIQRDGTYSVVPRVPGGEITPDKLIAIGTIAKKYDLYTKITGAQRVDLFGAQLHELPAIWRELIAAGFESGHAYGKALRTVKTCVGSTWCRYGVQDSVGLGIRLEHRYKGLRAPHKLKMAVSGCARECAEAQGKDVGVIATERGYNLYVCGNGGQRPRHADLFATDLDEETLVRYVDRFLMFYVRTADKLQRTARWLESLDGGLDYLKRVVIDDELGIGAELEAQMAHVVGSYRCEWKATVDDPEKLRMFRTFVNDDTADEELFYVRERGQRRPAPPRNPEGEHPWS